MIAPLSALRAYTDIDIPIPEYAARMIRQGIQVEGWEDLSETAQNIVVGRVVKLTRHPNADSLFIAQIDAGGEPLQIVTGADNLFEGALVPVALHGAVLPDGKRIKRGKLRGEASEGMLCSGAELNLTESVYPGANADGILILREDYAPGTDVRPLFALDDVLIDYDILANRPDCQSLLGIARESAVACATQVRGVATDFAEAGAGNLSDHLRVRVEDAELCPRYMARVVRNVKIAPSPLWLRLRLLRCGIRPVNNIVDITNWVMLELGQPMHAFDLRDVRGGEILVRRARPQERLTTLDGKERALTPEMLVIADGVGATGLAGVMGGLDSEIKADTTDIFFECAVFQSARTRITSRALGLRTESSARYEKGVSVHGTRRALHRALHLVCEFGAGEVVPGEIDLYPNPPAPVRVSTTGARIRGLTGVPVPTEEMRQILSRLQFDVAGADDEIAATAPDFRQDIGTYADLAEEVLRVYGYDALDSRVPQTSQMGRNHPVLEQRARLSGMLCGDGWHEIYTYAFISPKEYDKLALPEDSPIRRSARLLNPLGEDYSAMCTTLAPGMLTSMATNQTRQIDRARLFEAAVRFLPQTLPLGAELPEMSRTLCLGAYGEGAGFYALKSQVERLIRAHGVEARYRAEGPEFYHPGRRARMYVGETCVGEMGEIHPGVVENYGLSGIVCLAELDLDALRSVESEMGPLQELPRFPAVTRDIAVLVKADQRVGDLMDAIQAAAGALLEDVALFDVYKGPPLEPGMMNVAFRLRIRAKDRTLTDEEIVGLMQKVVDTLKARTGAELR